MEKDTEMKENSSKDTSEIEQLEKEIAVYRQTEILKDRATASYYQISAVREQTEVLKGIGQSLNNIGKILDVKKETDELEEGNEDDDEEDVYDEEDEEEPEPPKKKFKDLKPKKRRPLI